MLDEDDLLSIEGIENVDNTFNNSVGGFKAVFACTVNGRSEVVKVSKIADGLSFNKIKLLRLKRELGLLYSLESPYLPRIGSLPVQQFTKEGKAYIIHSEELIEGADVSELILKDFFEDPYKVLQLLHDVATAIQVYWQHATVHRDVKPANIRYSYTTENFVLIDAGIALVRDKTAITPTGLNPPQTPAYAAPEVVKGERNLSYKTDLFCLGVVAYEAAAKFHPFYSENTQEDQLYRAIVNSNPTPLTSIRSDLPEEAHEMIDLMLSKRPHQRPIHINDIIKLKEL